MPYGSSQSDWPRDAETAIDSLLWQRSTTSKPHKKDELHTHRGRQGADVALLIRRLRDRVGGDSLQYVGISATMASGENFQQQRREVATIATKFFGATVLPDDVIGETLRPATKPVPPGDPGFLAILRESVESDDAVPSQYERFVSKTTA